RRGEGRASCTAETTKARCVFHSCSRFSAINFLTCMSTSGGMSVTSEGEISCPEYLVFIFSTTSSEYASQLLGPLVRKKASFTRPRMRSPHVPQNSCRDFSGAPGTMAHILPQPSQLDTPEF